MNFGDWLESACIPYVLALERLVLKLRTHCCCERRTHSDAGLDAGLDASVASSPSAADEDAGENADSEAEQSVTAAPPGCSECALAAFADATMARLLAQLAEFAPDRLLCEMLAMHADNAHVRLYARQVAAARTARAVVVRPLTA